MMTKYLTKQLRARKMRIASHRPVEAPRHSYQSLPSQKPPIKEKKVAQTNM